MADSRELLEEAFNDSMEKIKSIDDSKERSAEIENACKMYRVLIEDNKTNWETSEKESARLASDERLSEELAFKKEQANEEKKHTWIKHGIEIFGISLPVVFYGFWMRRGFEFERNGYISSSVFKGLISKFKPTRK